MVSKRHNNEAFYANAPGSLVLCCLFLFKIATISACSCDRFFQVFTTKQKSNAWVTSFSIFYQKGNRRLKWFVTPHLMQHNSTHHADIFSCSKRFSIDNSADKCVEKYVQCGLIPARYKIQLRQGYKRVHKTIRSLKRYFALISGGKLNGE